MHRSKQHGANAKSRGQRVGRTLARAALAAAVALAGSPAATKVTPVSASGFTVSLSTSATSSTAGTPVTLTATSNQDVSGTGYLIEVYDQTDTGMAFACRLGATCTGPAVQYTATTHSYIAYIASYADPGPPPNIQATSNTISVSYSGSYTWTLTLTASPTSVPAGNAVNLTATANATTQGTGDYIELFDHTTTSFVGACGGSTGCGFGAQENVPTTDTFIAYIAPFSTKSDPPPNTQVTSNTVAVTWTAPTLSLSASPSSPAAGQTTTLTATSSASVTGTGNYLEIYDHTTGALLNQCSGGATCNASATQVTATTHSYIAYIAAPGTTDPPPSVESTSNTVSVTWQPSPSDACGAAQVVVFDGYLSGDYLRIRALTSGSQTLICYRSYSAASGASGGNISIATPAPQVGTPTTDTNYQACQAAGSPPVVAGTFLGEPLYLDIYTSTGAAWVCLQAGPLQERIIAPVSVSGTPSVTPMSDAAGLPAPSPASGPSGYPSTTCQSSGGPASTQLLDANVGGVRAWLSAWQVSSSQVDVCARIAGSTAAGSLITLTVPPVPGLPSGIGLQPVFSTSASAPAACTTVIAQFTAPTFALLSTSAPNQVNPATVCVGLASVVESVTVGITGSPTVPPPPVVPLPTVSLDPDTP